MKSKPISFLTQNIVSPSTDEIEYQVKDNGLHGIEIDRTSGDKVDLNYSIDSKRVFLVTLSSVGVIALAIGLTSSHIVRMKPEDI